VNVVGVAVFMVLLNRKLPVSIWVFKFVWNLVVQFYF
jgi:hypothetical protein